MSHDSFQLYLLTWWGRVIRFCITRLDHRWFRKCQLFGTKPLSESRVIVNWGRWKQIWEKYKYFPLKEISLKMSSPKWWPFHHSLNVLTHWGRVAHICISKLSIIVSDNGTLLIGPLGTNFNEILIEKFIHFHSLKIHLKISSGKWRPFCLGLNVLKQHASVSEHPVVTQGVCLTLIPAWKSNYIHYKVWDEITYPFSKVQPSKFGNGWVFQWNFNQNVSFHWTN